MEYVDPRFARYATDRN